MRQELFSELRTIYETTDEAPNTFRLSIKLKDMIDGDILRVAVKRAMERYPYFMVRMIREGADVFYESNLLPLPVIETNGRITLGSAETNYHLMAICYWQNWLHIDCYHALTDGGGMHPMVMTLLYVYISGYYGIDPEIDNVRMPGDDIPEDEWKDPGELTLPPRPEGLISKWSSPAFRLDENHVHLQSDSIVTTVNISEKEFIPFSMSNDGSPATIVSLLLARCLDAFHPDAADPIVIAMCVNQRKALKAPLAHQSLVGDVRLVYDNRIKKMSFMNQATCFRGMVALQSDRDMVLDEIRDYQALIAELRETDSYDRRREICIGRQEERSKYITATVSYIGGVNFGIMEHYLQEFDPLPSTALPSVRTPLTIEMVSMNGSIILNFIQYFPETEYFDLFVKQLRENNINYNVLRRETAWYPLVRMP